jgi:hypothetical protein
MSIKCQGCSRQDVCYWLVIGMEICRLPPLLDWLFWWEAKKKAVSYKGFCLAPGFGPEPEPARYGEAIVITGRSWKVWVRCFHAFTVTDACLSPSQAGEKGKRECITILPTHQMLFCSPGNWRTAGILKKLGSQPGACLGPRNPDMSLLAQRSPEKVILCLRLWENKGKTSVMGDNSLWGIIVWFMGPWANRSGWPALVLIAWEDQGFCSILG